MTIKIEVPSNNPEALAVFGRALLELSGEAVQVAPTPPTATETSPPPPATATETPTPPPATATEAPTPPTTTATETPTAPEVDKRGMPYDERIHTRTGSKLANGNWKNKRGVDPAVLQTVEAELAARVATQAATATETPTPPTATATETPTPPTDEPLTFAAMVPQITALFQSQKIALPRVNEIAIEHGFASIAAMTTATPEQLAAVLGQVKLEAGVA